MLLLGLPNILLQLSLLLAHIHIVQQWIPRINFYSHELWLISLTLAVDVLHNLVISRELFFVFCEDLIDSLDGCVGDKLLELIVADKVGDIRMEDDIVSHAHGPLIVLIVLTLAHSVRQTPGCSFSPIWLCHFDSIGLLDSLVPAHIDECFLVKELLLVIGHHLLCRRLDTEASVRLNERRADWEFATFFHFSEILIVLGSMLWI